MKKIALLCLVITCIAISLIPGVSSAQQGKFPIQIIDDTTKKTTLSEAVKNEFIKRINASPYYRLADREEDRMIIRFSVGGYLVTSTGTCYDKYINTMLIVWCAKPKEKCPRYIYNNGIVIHSVAIVVDDFMKDTDSLYNNYILHDYSYYFGDK